MGQIKPRDINLNNNNICRGDMIQYFLYNLKHFTYTMLCWLCYVVLYCNFHEYMTNELISLSTIHDLPLKQNVYEWHENRDKQCTLANGHALAVGIIPDWTFSFQELQNVDDDQVTRKLTYQLILELESKVINFKLQSFLALSNSPAFRVFGSLK